MSKSESEFVKPLNNLLLLDVGNTAVKLSYATENGWLSPLRYPKNEFDDMIAWMRDHMDYFRRTVISTVVFPVSDRIIDRLPDWEHQLLYREDIPPEKLDYDSIKMLGMDRYLGCYGAAGHYGAPVVVVDAGTACTVDFMDEEQVYRGGVIMPGLSLWERSLQQYAVGLPTASREVPDHWPGHTTEQCLQWGLTAAFRDCIGTMLDRYKERQGDYKLVMTGGDAELVKKLLKRGGTVDPALIFRGIDRFWSTTYSSASSSS